MRTLESRLREEKEGGIGADDSGAEEERCGSRDGEGAEVGVVRVERKALAKAFVRIRVGISSTMLEKVN